MWWNKAGAHIVDLVIQNFCVPIFICVLYKNTELGWRKVVLRNSQYLLILCDIKLTPEKKMQAKKWWVEMTHCLPCSALPQVRPSTSISYWSPINMGAIGLPRRWISRDFWNVAAWLVLVTSLWKGCSGGKSSQDKCKVTKFKTKK